MTPAKFIRKWGPTGTAHKLNERAGAQLHFMDLCQILDVPGPDDPETYCFERGFKRSSSQQGFADVWKRGHFAWEYKAPGKSLTDALQQLMQYALPLENPPLLIVSDRERIEIHTHFTGHPSQCTRLRQDELIDPKVASLLRDAFVDPYRFKPERNNKEITEAAASAFAAMADRLRNGGTPSLIAAHFLTQCLFCFYAEDAGLLSNNVFKRVVGRQIEPTALRRRLSELFTVMRKGGDFGSDDILWFNGGLFNVIDVPVLTTEDTTTLREASHLNWKAIDPSIFGTLFERGLDPSKRSQLGAHYTDAATVSRLIEPIIRRPLLEEWDEVKREIAGLLSSRDYMNVRAKGVPSKSQELKARHAGIRSQASKANRHAKDLFAGFLERLNQYRVLDPACGSGNFLYLALKALKDVELQANVDAEELGLERQFPVTGPHNVLGIEVNEYASELARATIWIGELQWLSANGYGWKTNPVLEPLDQIERRDALLTSDGAEASWPHADTLVGNPPFVGDKKMRNELGNDYTEHLRAVYKGRVPGGADLVCYWFEKARAHIEAGALKRAGLVSTNSIRGGKSREVLDRVCNSTRIFEAWSDMPWINNGAAVRVSLISFGSAKQASVLDGTEVARIGANLEAAVESIHTGVILPGTKGASFQGPVKVGSFDIPGELARQWLQLPNPGGRSNSHVLPPWVNGLDVVRRPSDTWIIDFGIKCTEADAALFEAPFAYVEQKVKAARLAQRRESRAKFWYLHGETVPGLRKAVCGITRYAVTPRVAKHRIWAWRDVSVLPDSAVVIVARSDDTTFGLLHSRMHELWSLGMCTWLGKGNDPRYTPTTCFETFPFPTGMMPAETAHQRTETLSNGAHVPATLPPEVRVNADAIASAAHRLTTLRDAWLNPPEWTQRIPEVTPLGMTSSLYPERIVARLGFEGELAKRTLTNLYNKYPAWLAAAHTALDSAVAAAYGWNDWSPKMKDEEILLRLLALNRERASCVDQ
jgi:hypothetical protein